MKNDRGKKDIAGLLLLVSVVVCIILYEMGAFAVTPDDIVDVNAGVVANTSSSVDNYVGSVGSDKYHHPDCQYAESIKSSNEIWFSSTGDAEEYGYIACKVCEP